MNVSKETMERMAALSKLELSQAELEQLSGELETIVNYMDILSQLPMENADPVASASPLRNVLREDRVICNQDRSILLSNAPKTDGKTLVVPKTMD